MTTMEHKLEFYNLVLDLKKQLRDLKLHQAALKRMMFEHRPAFVPAFEHQLGEIESSGILQPLDNSIRELEQKIQKLTG